MPENQSAPSVQHHQKASNLMVWGNAGYWCKSIITEAVWMAISWTNETSQT